MRKVDTIASVLPEPASGMEPVTGAELGSIIGLATDGGALLRIGRHNPVEAWARFALRTTRDRVEAAIEQHQPVVVLFEGGDRSKPLIVGFIESLQPSPTVTVDPCAAADAPIIEVDVDGRRVKLTAQDEIVLQCGQASITLRRNGRVIVRGTYVETHSEGTNRIKGGQVQIN